MNIRLKTNIDIETTLSQLQNFLQVSSKAAVMRICIAYSLMEEGDPREQDGEIRHYDITKQNGADYNRYTIYGPDEYLYKMMMEEALGRYLTDQEFFPEMTNAHLERGIIQLSGDIRLSKIKDRFLKEKMKVR